MRGIAQWKRLFSRSHDSWKLGFYYIVPQVVVFRDTVCTTLTEKHYQDNFPAPRHDANQVHATPCQNSLQPSPPVAQQCP